MSVLTDLAHRLRRWAYAGFGRDRWQLPDRVVDKLELRAGAEVADIGSGGGYFTLRLARTVGPGGRVLAVDTDHGLLTDLVAEARSDGLDNVVPVFAEAGMPSLPDAVDVAFASNAYHHLPDQPRYFAALTAFLRPGGRVVIVEPRGEGILARIFGHATRPATIRAEMEEAGYELVADHGFLPRQSMLVFRPR